MASHSAARALSLPKGKPSDGDRPPLVAGTPGKVLPGQLDLDGHEHRPRFVVAPDGECVDRQMPPTPEGKAA
jgi:hypothetical protein